VIENAYAVLTHGPGGKDQYFSILTPRPDYESRKIQKAQMKMEQNEKSNLLYEDTGL